DVMKKIEDDIGKKLVEQGIKPSTLFFDTTNFFTYIEHGEDIPKKGKSKEKRYDVSLDEFDLLYETKKKHKVLGSRMKKNTQVMDYCPCHTQLSLHSIG
ncbi:MAG: hypothetical protein KAR85_05430, partial [Methanosarcinales archaeon]|nr:hypothetical protein [Methanosarcinales archaeon]